MHKYPYIYVFFFLVFSSIQAQNNTEEKPLFELSYYDDVHSEENYKSIQQKKFISTKEKYVNLGITKSALWVKVDLNTKKLDPKTIIEVQTPLKDSITVFYTLKNKEIVTKKLGLMYAYSKNKFNHYLPVFEIPINDLNSNEVYIKVKSRYSMFFPLDIKSTENFYKERVNSYIVGGLLIGGLLLMGIYNLFLYFSVRDFSYILYVIALLSAILSQGYLFGILTPYLSPESPEFNFRFPLVIMCNTGIFSSLFTIRFLNVKANSKFLYYLLLFAATLLFLNGVFELLQINDYISRKANIILIISTSLVIFSSALNSLLKKNSIAIYFTIAWTFYLFGMITFALKSVGILPHNSFTDHFMHVGTFMEVMLLSFALGHKYSLIRLEKERLERQTRKELELLVKKQTEKLKISLEEKEVLLKEVHHRVKNNLQIVISLLDLQVASIKNTKNKEILAQSKSRVYSMSLIHQKLYQSDNFARINIKNYIEELFTYVKNSYHHLSLDLKHSLTIDDKELSLTKAIPLGLIINELLTNCFKHSFKNDKANELKISVDFNEDALILIIADSGEGFDQNTGTGGVKKSLGLFLIKSLSKQLRGNIIRYHKDGLFVTQLTIPTKEAI